MKSLVPPKRPQITEAKAHQILMGLGELVPVDSPVLVLAIRGYYLDSMGVPGENDRGIYDDAKAIIAPNHFSTYNANTDPGYFKTGVASLVAPQVIKYKPGWHGYGKKSGHRAFRQASPVIVKRDGGRGNGIPLGGGLFTDKGADPFWINDHRGYNSTVGSAGCQTTPPDQWEAYSSTLRLLMKREGVDHYHYILTEDSRIA